MTQSIESTIEDSTFRTITVNDYYPARHACTYSQLPTALGEPYAH